MVIATITFRSLRVIKGNENERSNHNLLQERPIYKLDTIVINNFYLNRSVPCA